MLRTTRLLVVILTLVSMILSLPALAQEQGFAVQKGAQIEFSVNGVWLKEADLPLYFEISDVDLFTKYVAKPNSFDGSETLSLKAVLIDNAGNRSVDASLIELEAIDTTSPEAPAIAIVANDYSDYYADGFTLSASATAIIEVNQLVIQSHAVDQWFKVVHEGELRSYLARPGIFDGTEIVEVSAYQTDIKGNHSTLTQPLKLPPIDTVSPGNPVVLSLTELQSRSQLPVASENASEIAVEESLKIEAARSKKPSLVAELNPVASDIVDDTPVSTMIDEDETLDELVAKILSEPQVSDQPQVRSVKQTSVDVINLDDNENQIDSDSVDHVVLDAQAVNIDVKGEPLRPADQIFNEVSGELLAATNGLDPFKLLNVDPTLGSKDSVDIPDTSPTRVPPLTHIFDIRTYDDTQKLIDWMQRESESVNCPILEAEDHGALHEILACLDLMGYPQAQMEELPDGIRIDTGERMLIESVDFSQVFNPDLKLSPNFIDDLSHQPLSKNQHTKAIERLEGLGFVRDASFDYYARAPGVYDAEIVGQAGESSLSLGASLTATGQLFGALKGRHFFDYKGLRYLDYVVGSDLEGQYEVDIALPVYYSLDHQVDLEFGTVPRTFRFFDSRVTEFSARWHDFSGGKSLNLAEVSLGMSRHSVNPKTTTQVSPQSIESQWIFNPKLIFKAHPGWVNSDSLSLSIGAGHNLETSKAFVQTNIDYDTGKIPIVEGELNLSALVNGSSMFGDRGAAPLDTRLYLGGPSSVRGVKNDYLGADSSLHNGGGDHRIISQIELSRPVTLFDNSVDLGLHLDAGYLGGDGVKRSVSAVSMGLFGRADLSDSTSAYAYLSRANVDSDEASFIGISLVRKF